MSQFRGKSELDDLILRKLDGSITRSDYERLVSLLREDAEAADYYIDFTLLYASLSEPGKIVFGSAEAVEQNSYDSLFAQLAEEEKNAAALTPVRQPEQPVLVQGVRERKKKLKASRQISRFNIWFTISSLAAMLMLVLYVVHHPRPMPMDVATLTDAIDAQWKQAEFRPLGSRFKNTDISHVLTSGLATITFDYGAEVILEGPVEFSILSAEKLHLHYGRLFARVPGRAVGFTVDMPGGSIIDLGTEFGVVARLDGTGDVKLFTGSASLLAGEQGIRSSSRMLVPGQANRVFGDTGRVIDVSLDPHEFVRRFDSSTGIIWKGQSLDLADFIGDGCGLGTGRLEAGIDPRTAQRGDYAGIDRDADNRYILMTQDRYIDGVFVPDGRTLQVVTSQGHSFDECPPTSGIFYTEIINGSGQNLAVFSDINYPLGRIEGRVYGTADNPGIFLHTNLGITYDLNAIRVDLPEFAACTFTADAGLSTAAPRDGNAEIWVLVDGQIRFHQKVKNEKGKAYPVQIPLKQTDRFLTLVATDGGDPDVPREGYRATDSDWCVFVRPTLSAGSEEMLQARHQDN